MITLGLLIYATIVFILVYMGIVKPLRYWQMEGIPYLPPWSVFILAFQKLGFGDFLQALYNKFPNSRYFGFYHFVKPILLIRDPELIKILTLKEFNSFINRHHFVPVDGEPLRDADLSSLEGETWRETRKTLIPAFAENRVKDMFSFINIPTMNISAHFLPKQETMCIEVKDIFMKTTSDIYASLGFGELHNSLRYRDNRFFKTITEVSKNLIARNLNPFGITGKLMEFTDNKFDHQIYKYIYRIVKETIENRELEPTSRPDMLQVLTSIRDGTQNSEITNGSGNLGAKKRFSKISDKDVASQLFIFFLEGINTTLALQCYLTYELASNKDIQAKLQEEMDQTENACNGQLTYDAVVGMKYMDMVVSETLRKWPPTLITTRKCNKPFTIKSERSDEKSLEIGDAAIVLIPIYAIHRDPQYFPDPDTFNPERFSEKEKGSIKPFTYMPFGAGARTCIGSHLGVLIAKTIIFQLFGKFNVTLDQINQSPLVLGKNDTDSILKNGLNIKIQPRKGAEAIRSYIESKQYLIPYDFAYGKPPPEINETYRRIIDNL